MGNTVSSEHHHNEIRRLEHERHLAEERARHHEELAEQRRIAQEQLAAETQTANAERAAERALKEKELQLKQEELEAAMERARIATESWEEGRRPVKEPTKEEWESAKQRIQYDPAKLHIAVCGTSGSGKSSLINALRGLKDTDHNAAEVGVTETTKVITTYTDTRPVFSLFVWCDIPGAGTLDVPDWQYFNDQGLFVYDFIILPYDNRLTAVDVGILKNCCRFGIPVFTVRSKLDQHIANMVIQKYSIDSEDDEWAAKIKGMRPEYVMATRDDFKKNMAQSGEDKEVNQSMAKWLKQLKLYLVSAQLLRSAVQGKTGADISKKLKDKMVDEEKLIEDMLNAAAMKNLDNPVKEDGNATAGERNEPQASSGEKGEDMATEPVVNVAEASAPAGGDGDCWHYVGADGEKVIPN